MMYYVITDEVRSYRNALLHAEIRSPFPHFLPDWWDAQPLHQPLPSLTFALNRNITPPDNVFTGTIFQLYSARLVHLFAKAGIRFETFPATITYRKTEAVLSNEYYIFHLLEKYPGLDRKKTFVNKPAISRQRMLEPKMLFRDADFEGQVLIHRDLKAILDQHKITGYSYNPVADYE